MIIIKDGSHAKRIIKLLLYTGEFPYYSLGMLGEVQSVKRAVRRMSQSQEVRCDSGDKVFSGKLVNISGKGHLKTVRLNAYAFEFIESLFPALFQYYLVHTGYHRFKGDAFSVERNHRVAESLAMLLMAGIEMRPDIIPELLMNCTIRKSFEVPAHYHCRYLKSLIKAELKKNQFTRIVSAVFFETGCYAIYNTRKAVMKLCGEGEQKTRKHLEEIAKKNSFTSKVDDAILFGKDYEIAEKTLVGLENDPKEKTVFGHIYHHIHFVPMNGFGVKLLQLYTTPYWNEDMLEQIFETHEIRREVGVFQYDAKVGYMHYVSFLDSDMVKIRSVRNHIQTKPEELTVLCFKEQEAFLKSYMGEDIKLKIYDLDEMMQTLECERRKII